MFKAGVSNYRLYSVVLEIVFHKTVGMKNGGIKITRKTHLINVLSCFQCKNNNFFRSSSPWNILRKILKLICLNYSFYQFPTEMYVILSILLLLYIFYCKQRLGLYGFGAI